MVFKASDSLSEQIAQHLASKIIKGELLAKERIQELKVASELGVSRGSVREALLILQRKHLIDILPRRGAMVTELTEHRVQSLYEMVVELYSFLALKVAENWQAEVQLKPFKATLKELELLAEQRNIERYIEVSFDILRQALPIADNSYLEQILANVQPAIHRTYFLVASKYEDHIVKSLGFFKALIQVVEQRDQQQIRQVVAAYGKHHRDMLMKVVGGREY
ncbi:GntR family transcriptional regulator [Endozoicomonas sp. SM1973]|uniref:GntR family transcriptional regulator n=1 Tax=Spartinivicinus marinus TaxID=2994442 RepID=A0A853IDF8_9GAMM|nr:GntR family transcriptional regulator [Spartinivicinus marinus]MCX4028961.1 GntR family transcriptional regulator [Spartinivicinus marinus]NYZ65456.1 GntR family transcriptional regulator [Spartinivicinus marinus]